jgi:hypothetical protein
MVPGCWEVEPLLPVTPLPVSITERRSLSSPALRVQPVIEEAVTRANAESERIAIVGFFMLSLECKRCSFGGAAKVLQC